MFGTNFLMSFGLCLLLSLGANAQEVNFSVTQSIQEDTIVLGFENLDSIALDFYHTLSPNGIVIQDNIFIRSSGQVTVGAGQRLEMRLQSPDINQLDFKLEVRVKAAVLSESSPAKPEALPVARSQDRS